MIPDHVLYRLSHTRLSFTANRHAAFTIDQLIDVLHLHTSLKVAEVPDGMDTPAIWLYGRLGHGGPSGIRTRDQPVMSRQL